MKNIFILPMSLVMVLTLFACAQQEETNPNTDWKYEEEIRNAVKSYITENKGISLSKMWMGFDKINKIDENNAFVDVTYGLAGQEDAAHSYRYTLEKTESGWTVVDSRANAAEPGHGMTPHTEEGEEPPTEMPGPHEGMGEMPEGRPDIPDDSGSSQ